MSQSIDQRVVDMQFNNRQFESGVKESLDSINKLKKGLDFNGATKSLSGLNSASKGMSMAGLSSGLQTVTGGFSALGIMGITALANITNAAVNAGKRIVSALTVDPIQQGFGEYELKMGSIQTIMAGSGESLEVVNQKLAELNTYSDRTIYSFADMTSNIGKFTNAGVKLDDAVASIQGISNVAALSGANSNEASRAMYNFAQAISSGFVKLIDWKSIELANMATVEFKTQLLESAVAAGTVKKSADGMYETLKGTALSATKNFNDSLQDQWMTTEVLTGTLAKYSDETTDIGKRAFAAAQDVKTLSQLFDTLKEAAGSGWATSWELFFGDFEEGKALFTEINTGMSALIGNSADARNELLKFWKEAGGREDLIQSFRNIIQTIGNVLDPIKDAFQEFFPPITGKRIVEMTKSLKDFTERLKVMTGGTKSLKDFSKYIKTLANSEGMEKFTGQLNTGSTVLDKIKRIFRGLFALLDIGKKFFVAIFKGIKLLATELKPAGKGLIEFAASIGDWLVNLNETIEKGELFNKFVENLVKIISKVVTFISGFVSKIKNVLTSLIDFFKSLGKVDLSGLNIFSEKVRESFQPITAIVNFVKKVFSKIKSVIQKVLPVIMPIIDKLGIAFGNLRDKITESLDKAGFSGVLDFVNSILVGGLIFGLKKFVDSLTGVTDGVGSGITGFFQNFNAFGSNINNVLISVKDTLGAYQAQLKAGTLMKIAIAIAILAASLLVLSRIDSEKLAYAIGSITVLFAELMGSMSIFTKTAGSGTKGLFKASIAMGAMAVGVLILSIALKKLSEIDKDSLAGAIVAITYLTGSLIATAKLLSNSSGQMMKGTASFVIFAAAILLLAFAVKKLSALNPAQLTTGLVGVGAMMAELIGFMKLTKADTLAIKTAAGILLLSVALLLLSVAVKSFANLDVGQIAKGLTAMGGAIGEIILFIRLTEGMTSELIKTGFGIILLSAGLWILAKAIGAMGSLSLEQMGLGLLTMAEALGVITLAMNFMPDDMISKGAGFAIIAIGLLILAKAMKEMSGMSWIEIARGLTVLAGSLGIIALAMHFMTGALPGAAALLIVAIALKILAGSIQALGKMSLKEIGLSLLVLVGVFAILGLAALVLAPVIPAILGLAAALLILGVATLAMGAGLLLFSMALAALAVSGAAGSAALVMIVTSLISLIPMLLRQIGAGIIAFAEVIIQGAPVLFEAVRVLISGLLVLLTDLIPQILDFVITFILDLLARLVEFVPQFVDAGLKIIIGFLQGIADNIQGIVEAGIDIVLNLIDGISSKIPDIIDSAFNLIISFINGLADSIRDNHDALYDAIENLIDSIIEAITDFLPRLVGIGENIISSFIEGITNMARAAWDAAVNVVSGAVDGVKKFLGIRSPSKEFGDIGKNSALGLAEGLKKFASKVTDEAKNVGNQAKDTLKTAMEKINDIVSGNVDMDPKIRPVLDLSSVTSGAGTLNSMFNRSQAMTVAADFQNGSPTQRAIDELKHIVNTAKSMPVDVDGKISVEVRNDKGEIIGIAQTAVKDLLRRESR